MMDGDGRERFVGWLRDAHAMETALEKALTTQAEHAKADTLLWAKLIEHRDETRLHITQVEAALRRHGEKPSALKEITGKTQAVLAGWISGAASDTGVKDLLTAIAAEHFEIGSYRALRAAAEAMGDEQTVRMCGDILKEEEAMAEFLEGQLPRVTRRELEATPG